MDTSLKIFFNRWFLGILCLGSLALSFSIFAVQVYGLKPCFLCKLQKLPFLLLTANAAFGLITPFKEGFFRIILGCLCIGILLGITHFLVQMGMVPDFCTSQRNFTTAEEFLQALQPSKCSTVSWSVLGVPISLLNALLHGCVLGISIRLKSRNTLGRGAT